MDSLDAVLTKIAREEGMTPEELRFLLQRILDAHFSAPRSPAAESLLRVIHPRGAIPTVDEFFTSYARVLSLLEERP